jgi:hypothetical protein
LKITVTLTQQEHAEILTKLALAQHVLGHMRKSKNRDLVANYLYKITKILNNQVDPELEEIRNDLAYLDDRITREIDHDTFNC